MKKEIIELFNKNKEGLESLLSLEKIREQGINDFNRLGFPHNKMESWKNFKLNVFNNNYVLDLKDNSFSLGFFSELNGLEYENSILFQNGFCSYKNQIEEYKNGVIFGSLQAVNIKYPELVLKYINKAIKQNQNGLNAINNAFVVDGFFLYIPNNVSIELPFAVVNSFNSGNMEMVSLRNIVILEENSKVSITQIELSHIGDKQFVNNLSEVFIGKGSEFTWNSMQKYKGETISVNPIFVHQSEKSKFTKNIGTIGGNMVRNDIQVKLMGKQSKVDINGVYILNHNESIDNQVYIDHAVPDCDSNQFFKGVLDGKSKGAFTGYVLVREDSQRTNAFQSNKNVLISNDAKVYSKPFLEIYADDVKCSHGSSVGSLDENALFYLKARGIEEKKAKEILLTAFAMDSLKKLEDIGFKTILAKEIESSLLNHFV